MWRGGRQFAGLQERLPGRLRLVQRCVVEDQLVAAERRLPGLCAPYPRQGSPAGATMQDLTRRLASQVPSTLELRLVLRLGNERLQAGAHLRPRRVPVRAMHRLWISLHQAVGLQPFPLRAGGHREMFGLCSGEAGLDLDICMAGPGEERLPALAAGPVTPHEQLATLEEGRRGLPKASAFAIEFGSRSTCWKTCRASRYSLFLIRMLPMPIIAWSTNGLSGYSRLNSRQVVIALR